MRLAYLGIFEREATDIYPVVSRKVAIACGIVDGEMLDNPVTDNTRYWYHAIGELFDVHLWTVAQIVEWLKGLGL